MLHVFPLYPRWHPPAGHVPIFTKHNTRISILANLSFRTDKYLNLNIENVLLQCKQQLSNRPSLVTNQTYHWSTVGSLEIYKYKRELKACIPMQIIVLVFALYNLTKLHKHKKI
jgi:hypothetical protein